MKLKFFTVPALAPESCETELNRFLAAHRVAHIDRQLIVDGGASYWAVCVTCVDGDTAPGATESGRRNRVDYREVLAADEFALYDRLRTLRKQRADAEGVPPFAVFTNEQLADMVRQRITTAEALGALDGVGDSRLTQFAPAFLELLAEGVPRLAPKTESGGTR